MIKTLDIMDGIDVRILFGAFQRKLNEIASGPDRNAKNYLDFFFDRSEYSAHRPSLTGNMGIDVVMEEDEIIAFSSLYGNGTRYPKGYARALNRFWLHPDYRKKSLSGYHGKSIGSLHMLPQQLERAKELGLEAVFVSMEFISRRPAMEEFVKYNEDLGFVLLPHMYNTCGNMNDDKRCWQNIAVTWLGNARRLPLPRMEVYEWLERFS